MQYQDSRNNKSNCRRCQSGGLIGLSHITHCVLQLFFSYSCIFQFICISLTARFRLFIYIYRKVYIRPLSLSTWSAMSAQKICMCHSISSCLWLNRLFYFILFCLAFFWHSTLLFNYSFIFIDSVFTIEQKLNSYTMDIFFLMRGLW